MLATTTALASFALVLSGTSPATARSRHQDTHPRPSRTVALPNGLRPEGIASGPGTTYYAGSMRDGRVVTGDLRRGTSRVLLRGASGRQIRGMQRDPRSGLLWATGNVGTAGHVWAISTRTGRVVKDVTVPGSAFLNDLVVTSRAVWVTDSRVDRLARIAVTRRGAPTSAPLTFLALRGAWPTGTPDQTRANGIRRLGRHRLVLDHSTAGGLWDVDTRTGVVQAIPVTGVALTGGDGLERRGSTLWVVRGTNDGENAWSVTQLRLQRRHGSWTARFEARLTDPTLEVPSTATFAGGFLWAVNARFNVTPTTSTSYWITRLRPRR